MATRKRFSAELLPGADPVPLVADLIATTAEFAAMAALAPRDRDRLAIVVEELTSNAARHGAGANGIRIDVTLTAEPGSTRIVVEDDGKPFDPFSQQPFSGPDPETGGGVGLELVRAWCNPIVYAHDGDMNRIELMLPRSQSE